MRRLWWVGVFLFALGCDDSNPPVDPDFTCTQDAQCADGFVCDLNEMRCVADDTDMGVVPPPVPPDGQPPPGDGGLPDAAPDAAADAAVDATPPDAALDAALPDAALDAAPDAAPDLGPDACFVDPDPAPPPPEGLADLAVDRALEVGGPLAPPAFVAANLDGDAPGETELVVARGGRAETLGTDGRTRWSSAVLGISDIVGVYDLDGDGRQEVLSRSARAVHVLDALTGRALWTSPDRPFGPGEAALVQVLRVVVGDADGDDLPDLYLTDSGCTGGGTGYGAFFSFDQGVANARPLSIITGPRAGGRCARWHTLADLTGDGRPELLRSDALGIDAFDPISGQRTHCGPIPATGGAAMPHFTFDHDPATPGRELAVFDGTRLLVLAPDPALAAGCDGGATLAVRWQVNLGDVARPQGSGPVDLDGDGRLDLLTQAFRGDRWWLLGYSGANGAPLLELPDLLSAGLIPLADGVQAVVTVEGPARQLDRFGRIQLRQLRAGGADALWPAPITDAAASQELIQPPDYTGEFSSVLTFGAGDTTRVVLRQADAGDTRTARILTVDRAGVARSLPVAGDPGGAHRICTAGVCDPDRQVVALEDGALALIDADLRVLNAVGGQPAARAPTGDVFAFTAFDGVRTILVTLTASGALGGTPITPVGDPALAWRIQVGQVANASELLLPGYIKPVPRAGGADLLVLRDSTRNASGWRAVAADGRTLWLHTLDPLLWRTLGSGVVVPDAQGNADLFLRYDQLNDLVGLDAPCDATYEDPDLRLPLAACPNAAPNARVVTALDASTGTCRWRTALRPNRCANPSNQAISLADADQDGRPEVYVTSTNVVVQLDPTTGQPGVRADLGIFGAAGRGGGTLINAPAPPLLRYGGNGPIDAFDADLTLRWRAAQPDGLQGVAWLFRPALVVDDQVWISPGRGWPVYRYPLDSQGENVPPAGQIPLAGGAVVAPDAFLADVRSLHAVDDATPAGGGIFATTDDGWLYVLDRAGNLAWSRRLPAVAGPAVVADLDGDGAREIALPLNDGRVQIADLPGPPPPRVVWDLPCPPVGTCSDDADIDETRSTTTLCGEWYPVAGVVGYEVRVIDENGAILQDFFDVGAETTVQVDGLALIPGGRYALEVRSRWVSEGDLRRGSPRASDGVLVINDAAPTLELVADPDRFGPGGLTTLTLRASDDDLLAGWSLIITDPAGGLVARLGGGPLAVDAFEVQRDWNGQDRAKAPVIPGMYRAVASVVDRGRSQAVAEVAIEVCDGPCP